MKPYLQITAIVLLLLLCNFPLLAQIPNAGFENWTNGDPDGWGTSNIVFHNISRSTTAHSGSYSAKAEIVAFNGNPIGITLQAGTNAMGFPLRTRVRSYTGYYQFHPVGGDRLSTSIVLYKGKAVTGTLVGTGMTIPVISAEATSWTQFSVPVSYLTNDTPDSAVVNFVLLGPNSSDWHIGTYVLIDDLALDGTTAVADQNTPAPSRFSLADNYPNPFNPTTTISFSVPTESNVTLEVLNVLGQRVALLADGVMAPGSYQRAWNGNGSSGVYFYRMQAVGVNDPTNRFSEMKKMVLMK